MARATATTQKRLALQVSQVVVSEGLALQAWEISLRLFCIDSVDILDTYRYVRTDITAGGRWPELTV